MDRTSILSRQIKKIVKILYPLLHFMRMGKKMENQQLAVSVLPFFIRKSEGHCIKIKHNSTQGTFSWTDTTKWPNRDILNTVTKWFQSSTLFLMWHCSTFLQVHAETYMFKCTRKQTWNAFHLFYHFGMQIYSCVHNLNRIIHLPCPALPNRICVMSPTKNTFVCTC